MSAAEPAGAGPVPGANLIMGAARLSGAGSARRAHITISGRPCPDRSGDGPDAG